MRKNVPLLTAIVLIAIAGIFAYSRFTALSSPFVAISGKPGAKEIEQVATARISSTLNHSEAVRQTPTRIAPPSPALALNRENFERLVSDCFNGKPCDFEENPWEVYQYFKRSQHPRVCDDIIAVMRRKIMDDPSYREQNKALLLSMIQDFYSPEEKDFQIAAYYAYLGELRTSLDLYLDLEKRAAKDPGLRPAPKLNIANVYYDLHEYREAIPYFEAALAELGSGPEKLNEQRSVIQYIQKRIEQAQRHLGS